MDNVFTDNQVENVLCVTESASLETKSQFGACLSTEKAISNHAIKTKNETDGVSGYEKFKRAEFGELALILPTTGGLETVYMGHASCEAQLNPCGTETQARLAPEAELKDSV